MRIESSRPCRLALLSVLCLCGASAEAAAQACPAPPPHNLTAAIDTGRVVSLEWRFSAPSPAAAYVVEVGSAPGASDVMTLETRSPATSRIVQLPAGTSFVRVRNREGCLSTASNEVTITVAASAIDDANAIAFRCPTAAEMAAIDADIQLIFDGDPSAGTTVCTVGTRQLTFLQTGAYRSLIVMRRMTFDAPLPWTAEPLYDWLIHSIRAIRFRSDIPNSFCCAPADTINIRADVVIALPGHDDPWGVVGISELFVHEARHNNIGPHTCGFYDQTLAELGAWGAQYYTAKWIVEHSDPAFIPARIRNLERLSVDSLAATTFCSTAGPTMTLDRQRLAFGATAGGGAFLNQTGAHTVRLGGPGSSGRRWTAVSSVPWLTVSPTYGTGPALLTVSPVFASGLTPSQTGNITVTVIGTTSAPGPIAATLTVGASGAPAAVPFGSFDTPAGDATPLAGSIAVTGWALDNIGVKQVELWRDLQPGEPTPPFAGAASDPRNGKVFIANAPFVDGARPDVESLNATTPLNYRAGWGYLLLTWGLWNQGNGTYRLHAFALDQEGNTATLGTKAVVVNNNAATRPFGSIDTPAIGGDPGTTANFGWGLTPKVNGAATCRIPSNGIQVSIDSGPLQPVVYGDPRSDIAAAFPGFANSAAAGGHFIFDWSTLSNGPHTIEWVITDDCNRADGVGSRIFTVTGGTSVLAAPAGTASVAALRESDETLLLSRGHGELPEAIPAGPAGSRTIDVRQRERIELRAPRGFTSAYQLANGERRELPLGSTWDAVSGTFSWQPVPGFLGRYRLVFSNGRELINVRVFVRP